MIPADVSEFLGGLPPYGARGPELTYDLGRLGGEEGPEERWIDGRVYGPHGLLHGRHRRWRDTELTYAEPAALVNAT